MLRFVFLALLILFQPLVALAGPRNPIAELETLNDAQEAIIKVQEQTGNVGSILQGYTASGSKFNRSSGTYDKHAWYNGNPNFLGEWIGSETKEILSNGFLQCLEPRIVGIFYVPGVKVLSLKIEYWWPEVTGESGDFCIGSFLAGQLRPVFANLKNLLMKPMLPQLKTEEGESAWDGDDFSNLRAQYDFIQNSHFEDSGIPGLDFRNYESHVHRTFFDFIISVIARSKPFGSWGKLDCLRQCLQYNAFWFPLNWSEALIAPLWRLQELSPLRLVDPVVAGTAGVSGAEYYLEHYAPTALTAPIPGAAYHGSSLSPLLPHFKPPEDPSDPSNKPFTMENPLATTNIENPIGSIGDLLGGSGAINAINSGANLGNAISQFADGVGELAAGTINTTPGNGVLDKLFDSPLFAEPLSMLNEIPLLGEADALSFLFENPFASFLGAGGLKTLPLRNASCAAYRSGTFGKGNDFFQEPHPLSSYAPFRAFPISGLDDVLERNCYHSTAGQLFPLIGTVDVASARTAPINAIRRMFEWQSMNLWTEYLGMNYFNDFKGKNLYRRPGRKKRRLTTRYKTRRADKLQRIFPSPSQCFKMKDINSRDKELFPKELFLDDKERVGVYKTVHWNRRRCRILIRLPSLRCFWGKPLEE